MREIKFRQVIFHPVTNEFLRWHYWGLTDGTFVGIDTGWVTPRTAVKNSQMFINLLDKNGIGVYEGDILGGIVGGYVYYDEREARFGLVHPLFPKETREVMFDELDQSDLEVIGNIKENPGLLKEDSENE